MHRLDARQILQPVPCAPGGKLRDYPRIRPARVLIAVLAVKNSSVLLAAAGVGLNSAGRPITYQRDAPNSAQKPVGRKWVLMDSIRRADLTGLVR